MKPTTEEHPTSPQKAVNQGGVGLLLLPSVWSQTVWPLPIQQPFYRFHTHTHTNAHAQRIRDAKFFMAPTHCKE